MPNTQIHCPCCYLPLCYCYGLRQYMVSVCLAYSRLMSEQVRSRLWSWSIDDYLVPVRRCCITLTPTLAPPPPRFLRIPHNSVSRTVRYCSYADDEATMQRATYRHIRVHDKYVHIEHAWGTTRVHIGLCPASNLPTMAVGVVG